MRKLFFPLISIFIAISISPAYADDDDGKSISTGSGFFVTHDGYFVTNYHVVKNAKSFFLVTVDGRKLEAKMVRSDATNDLALLKVDGKYSALPIASSRAVRRGQSVATIGYPHMDIQGIEPKVTEGIVSSLAGISDDPRLFQISVPVQAGNSGGPLFTKEGNVIGIVASKLSVAVILKQTGDVTQNVNYAIKSDYLLALLDARTEDKLLPVRRGSKSLEDITAIVEKATALVVAFSAQPSMVTPTSTNGETRDCQRCFEMVTIPGGNYEIGKFEVTQTEWQSVMGSNPSYFKSYLGSNLPVEHVSWDDVQEFLTKLNQKTGRQYRLPTATEWEYACYGGKQTDYCGSDNINEVAWNMVSTEIGIHPVGQKNPNGYGLYDMSGNVWEWVAGCWNGDCAKRERRGGSWDEAPYYASATHREWNDSAHREWNNGFRLARTLPQ
ncbi:MAG: SUMF1/EgtB/PvdO family nonheme iron enzyme [Nitrosomonadales bacterium]|nr:SUMF1/EgtB/PvdO family nonheme iron enzyme [Nitrosomonadales bacterium]